MKFDDAFRLMGRDESFRATQVGDAKYWVAAERAAAFVYAMNTLLIKKGIYTSDEFEKLFCEHAINFSRGFSAGTAPADA